jgi:hypothetical protein
MPKSALAVDDYRYLEHFPCYWVSRQGLAVAFSLGKTPIAVVGPGYTHRENALSQAGRAGLMTSGQTAFPDHLLLETRDGDSALIEIADDENCV